jgi:2-oxoglutarate ferredoxin oxidoreductase subunit alpha
MHTRLRQKIDAHIQEMSFSAYRGPRDADVVIVAYGVTARTALAAYRRMVDQGRSVGVLILKTLWPVLEEEIASRCRSASRVIVPEMNLGQYAREVERVLPGKDIRCLGQMNGNLLTPDQILEVVHA